MAVVSEGTFYQAKIAPSYVSSSGYYGYVPPCPIAAYENVVVHEHQSNGAGEANDQKAAAVAAATGGLSWSLSVPMQQPYHHHHQEQQQLQQHNNQQELISFNGSAMETDDDDNCRHECVRVSRCENNHCVIPEAAGLRLDGGGGCESVYRVAGHDQSALLASRRGNRKRSSAGDPAYLFAGHPANITKKPRQDGGNGDVRDGAGRSGKRRSAAMHYEPRELRQLGDEVCRLADEPCAKKGPTIGGCRLAAGNYDSIGHSDLERPCILTSNGRDHCDKSYLDYEKMLMETHGCSAYHYHPHQHLNIAVLEAEF